MACFLRLGAAISLVDRIILSSRGGAGGIVCAAVAAATIAATLAVYRWKYCRSVVAAKGN